jgi:hypothetical protein
MYQMSRRAGYSDVRLMAYIKQSIVNPKLKAVALAVGDPSYSVAGSHGMRRGYACELALYGARVQDILAAGDWRSDAFRAYLESIKEEVAARGLLQVVGEYSDSDEE